MKAYTLAFLNLVIQPLEGKPHATAGCEQWWSGDGCSVLRGLPPKPPHPMAQQGQLGQGQGQGRPQLDHHRPHVQPRSVRMGWG